MALGNPSIPAPLSDPSSSAVQGLTLAASSADKATPDSSRLWPALLAAGLFWGILIYQRGPLAGLYTVGLSLAVALLFTLCRRHNALRLLLAYAVFFTTPLLTLTGQIGVLTGFGGSSNALPWLGISFVTASLALAVLRNQLTPRSLFLNILQPARWNSGPCAIQPLQHGVGLSRLRPARLLASVRWVVLGAFFYGVVSHALGQLLLLKSSTQAADVLAFAVVFEAYVYFNFAGISFMVFGLLRTLGVPCVPNFNTPFAARHVVGYWQRWHMSLSAILKNLIYLPLKPVVGVPLTVLAVFVGSALWHGVSLNFIAWGIFHGTCWFLSYRLARLKRGWQALQWILLPFAVVIGRLIFSESDSALLREKLVALTSPASWAQAPLLLDLRLDVPTAATLGFAMLWLTLEVFGWSKALRYRLLRHPLVSVALLAVLLVWGTVNVGGVYGTR